VSNRWGNILDFQGFDLITPNEREARFGLGDQDSGVRPMAQTLFQRAGCRYLDLEACERGILTLPQPGAAAPRVLHRGQASSANLVDPIGAGDALLAMATLALAPVGQHRHRQHTRQPRRRRGVRAAGNVPVVIAEVEDKLDALKRAAIGA